MTKKHLKNTCLLYPNTTKATFLLKAEHNPGTEQISALKADWGEVTDQTLWAGRSFVGVFDAAYEIGGVFNLKTDSDVSNLFEWDSHHVE